MAPYEGRRIMLFSTLTRQLTGFVINLRPSTRRLKYDQEWVVGLDRTLTNGQDIITVPVGCDGYCFIS